MHKLGLDLGTKSCGFAISDENNIIVSPLENYLYSKNDFLQVINRIKYWLNEYDNRVDSIILGYPLNINDSKNNRTLMVEKFYQLLLETFPNLSIYLQDERYSTKQATEELMQYGLKASQRHKIKDKMAATIILESYLQKEKR